MKSIKKLEIQVKAMIIAALVFATVFASMIAVHGFSSF